MPFYSYPRIPGHELGVEVLAIGENIRHVKPGDHCSVEPYLNNPSSFASSKGRTNCCEDLRVLGVHCDGGLRATFNLPARKLHISKSLSMEQLALVETLAIGCHAVNRGNPQTDETVLIIGAGPIGLSVMEFVKLTKAKTIVMDMNEKRLAFCRDTMKIDHTITARGDGSELKELEELTDGHLASVVIDATGSNVSMSNALHYVGFTGRLVFVGITTQLISFEHPLMHRREMTLLSSRNALPAEFKRIIKLIEEDRINTRPWITHHTDFDSLIGDFPSYLKPETGVIKAMVHIDCNL
jgi:alcohol dehydrogenase